MRWTEDQLREWQQYVKRRQEARAAPARSATQERAAPPRRPKAGEPTMNKTEARYATLLGDLDGVVQVRFEAIRLRLGHRLHYTPDFWVLRADGTQELHEVKGGFVREDAVVKFKAAAAMWGRAYRFYLAQWKGGEWRITEYGG